jgi:hypothetical protein
MGSKADCWGHLDNLLDACVLIWQSSRTAYELTDLTECQGRTIQGYIRKLTRFGLIRVLGRARVGRCSIARPVYEWTGDPESGPRICRGSMEKMLRVLKMMLRGQCTARGLVDGTGFKPATVRGYVRRIHRGGMVYVSGWVRHAPGARLQAVYSPQSHPFGQEDVAP